MRHYAYGYTSQHPDVAPNPVTVIPVEDERAYDALVDARRELWWSHVTKREWWERPTRASRALGYVLVAAALLLALGIAGRFQ